MESSPIARRTPRTPLRRWAWIGAGLAVAGALVVPAMVSATPATDGEHKITICHRTDSNTNPYVVITVDTASADGSNQNETGGKGDHFLEHVGPVWNSTLKDQKIEWGDIIPPIPGVHGGLNWNAEGQAIYFADCSRVVVTTTTVTVTSTSSVTSLSTVTQTVTTTVTAPGTTSTVTVTSSTSASQTTS
jgi:hypothetical protein